MALLHGTIELLGHESCRVVEVMVHAQNKEDATRKAPIFVHDIDPTLRLGRMVEDFVEVPAAAHATAMTTGSINLLI